MLKVIEMSTEKNTSKKASSWKIPLFKMYWDNEDVSTVSDAITCGVNWAIGKYTTEFEEKIAAFNGSKYCVTFNSGTSALHAALIAHGIKADDEVIVPSYTFISTANSPLFVGAKPVFADIEPNTCGLNPEDVEAKITKNTKAIIPVHFAGMPCRIKEIKEIAEDHNLILLEDNAESFGATVDGKKAGTFGNSGMVSFCQNKILTTGDGGAIITDERDTFEKLKLVRSHGRLDTENYFNTNAYMDYVTLGYNFRLPNILAALGVAQINKINTILDLRRKAAEHYNKRISEEIPEITLPQKDAGCEFVYQMYPIRAQNRDALMEHMKQEGIMTKVYFTPIHTSHFYKNVLKIQPNLPVTDQIGNENLCLPFYPGIPEEDLDAVVDAMKAFYRK